ncbi:MAG: hypothetical protein IKA83_06095, partial [Paludibacteraceae bacterium]|nr:hypothetical protein [Paludibacteraceae bacterium]
MRNIISIIFVNRRKITQKISNFYIKAKQFRYPNSYDWEEVLNDIQLSAQDKNLIPTNKTTNLWLSNGYDVARNKRGWAFAYVIENDTMYIYDTENCRNLTINYQNTNIFTISLPHNLQQIEDNEIEAENQLYTESNYDKEYDDNVVLSATDRVLDLLSECGVDVKIINNSDYNDSFLARIGVKIKGVNNPFEDIRTASERICGFTSGNTIYLTRDGINPETPIHEYTHLWCKVIERTRPKEWEEIVSNIKGTPIWNEVLDDEKYAKIHSNDSRVASEALARISGRRGAQKLIKYAKEAINEPDEKYKGIKATLVNNMKKAVQKLWTIVKSSIFRSEKKTNEIADTILNDLITGKTVNKDTLNIIKNGTKNRFKQSNDESNSNHS